MEHTPPRLRQISPSWNGQDRGRASLTESGGGLATTAMLMRVPLERLWNGSPNHSAMPYPNLVSDAG